MPAILAPYEAYIWAFLALILIGGGLYVAHRLEVDGEQKIIAKDQAAVAAQVERNQAVQTVAGVATSLAGKVYEQKIAAPITNAPVARLCRPTFHSGPVSVGPAAVTGGFSLTPGGTADPAGPDIGPTLITIGRNADALITALQSENAALRKEMTK